MNNTPTPRTDELYRDHMSDPYQDTGDLAAIMHIQCERFERELTAVTEQRDGLRSGIDCASDQLTRVTEQRDEARRLAEKYRNLSCDSQEEADETLLPWENNQPKPESKDPHRFCRGGGGNNFHCGCKYDG